MSSRSSLCVASLKVLAITVLSGVLVFGQAGRHIPKSAQATPEPAATPVPTSIPKERPKASFTLKVVADLPFGVYQIFPRPENMPAWAVDRLRTSSLLDIRDSGTANRRDAIKLAKAETEAYVVWLQLQDDAFGTTGIAGGRPAAGEVAINFEILSPVTGKTKNSGSVRLNQNSINGRPPSAGTVALSCHKGIFGNDFILLQASLEAAERIMLSLNIPIPPDCRIQPGSLLGT